MPRRRNKDRRRNNRAMAGWRAAAWMLLIIFKCRAIGRLINMHDLQQIVRKLANGEEVSDLFTALKAYDRIDLSHPSADRAKALDLIVAARIGAMITSGHLVTDTAGRLEPVHNPPWPLLELLPDYADSLISQLLETGQI